jgi:hypothetical protein
MTADYSVSCSSEKYRFGFVWACVMIFVYPIGCPAYYFYLLFNVRHEITSRSEEVSLERVESLDITDKARARQQKLISLKFLYESYHPWFWWWEIAETTQRLVLTGILVLIVQGSAVQIIVGSLLTLTFLHLYARYEPFSDAFVLSIKIISYWQIFFVFWIALLIKAEFHSISDRLLGVCLVFTVFANVIIDLGKVSWAIFTLTSWAPRYSTSSKGQAPPAPPLGDDGTEMRGVSVCDEETVLAIAPHCCSTPPETSSPFHQEVFLQKEPNQIE